MIQFVEPRGFAELSGPEKINAADRTEIADDFLSGWGFDELHR